jgi:hypothetical protein
MKSRAFTWYLNGNSDSKCTEYITLKLKIVKSRAVLLLPLSAFKAGCRVNFTVTFTFTFTFTLNSHPKGQDL